MLVWRDANYPHIWWDRRPDRPKLYMGALGWNSTYETKRLLVGTMQGVIKREQIRLHHPSTYYEMTHWVVVEDKFEPARRSGHDDTVMALGVAIMSVVTEAQNLDFSTMSAPGPAYVPGNTPPRFHGQGKTPDQVPGIGRLAPVGADDSSIGVDAWYE
jgi:hypothetical protein